MAGSGELEEELRAYCVEHALDNVVFTGFITNWSCQLFIVRLIYLCFRRNKNTGDLP